MHVEWQDFWSQLEAIYNKEDSGNLDNYESERPTLNDAISAISHQLDPSYSFLEPVGRGGAGIVVKLRDNHLELNRALKLPRPRKNEQIESVRNEIEHLNKLRHDNIIQLHRLGEVEINGTSAYPFFVMDFIENATDIRSKVEQLLRDASNTQDLKRITRWVATRLAMISDALAYLHDNSTIHFDVKPGNILVDSKDKPILSDLGFAKGKSDLTTPTVVGFTHLYAHPDLTKSFYHMSSKNRVHVGFQI